jgi:hypothetical protein
MITGDTDARSRGALMRDLFAIDDPRADAAYKNIRAPKGEGAAVARANCDDLWRDFAPYASEHFRTEFRRHFHQRWFEMYLAVALLRAGLNIACPAEGAPDVRVQHRDGSVLWLEATSPTGGDKPNPDRVEDPIRPGGGAAAFYVPTERVILRVSGGLHTKAAALRDYRAKGVIAPEDQALVAINVRDIPFGLDTFESCAFGATYGVGSQFVTLDRDTGDVVDSGYQHRPMLLRGSGSVVDAAPFLHAGFEHVAGALISAANVANCPHPPGQDFMLLPNPNGAPAYTERQLPIGREWRLGSLAEGGGYPIIEVIEHSNPILIVRLFHATTQENARRILATGFVDRSRELHQGRWYLGVWLAEVSLYELEPVILLVSMAEDLVRQYELPGDQGYRRWLVPAEVINRCATIVEFPRRAKPHPGPSRA